MRPEIYLLILRINYDSIKVVQRVVFLHEELMKLPFFPRKALECDLDLYRGGELGKVSVNDTLYSRGKIYLFRYLICVGIVGIGCIT